MVGRFGKADARKLNIKIENKPSTYLWPCPINQWKVLGGRLADVVAGGGGGVIARKNLSF